VAGTVIEAPDGSTVFESGYEPDMTAAVARLTSPGFVCADVGAHFGWFTVLMAARAGDDGAVYSFEASAENADVVEHNVKLNDYANRVRLYRATVADRAADEVELYAARSGGSMEWTLIQEFAERDGPRSSNEVRRPAAVTLDGVFPRGHASTS
jgi:FkbM family methyltransferase